MAPRQYWYFLISGQYDGNGFITSFYAFGQHCGEALENALQAAIQELGVSEPEVTEAARLDTLTDFEEPADLIQLTELVQFGPSTYSYPLDSSEKSFIPPTGVIKAIEDDELDYELIKENFIGFKTEGSDIYEFELVVEKGKLIDTFFQAIHFIPKADQVEIIIQGHWENQPSELWVADLVQTQLDATAFLLENQSNILENGFITCTLFSTAGETKLILDEHKTIRHSTTDEAIFSNFGQQIMALGFEQTTELYSLDNGYYHWHYRPINSLDASDFRILLIDAGFRFVKSWEEESAE